MTAIPDDIREQLKAEAAKAVKEAYEKASEAERREELEKNLLDAKEKLAEAASKVEELLKVSQAKDEEIAAVQDELKTAKEAQSTEVESKTKELSQKLSDLEQVVSDKDAEIAKISEERDLAQASLASIEKDRLTEKRMSELAQESIAFQGEEAAKSQTAKIREMSEEQFNDYKNDLILVRNLARAQAGTSSSTSEAASEEIPAPVVNEGASAAPQVELSNLNTNTDVSGKFTGFGDKLAQYISESRKAEVKTKTPVRK